jgi:NADH-quinone oxidoreductase subunit C
MTNEMLESEILTALPIAQVVPGNEWLTLQIPAKDLRALAVLVRHRQDLFFDYLFCVTAIDYKTKMTMVYHLTSTHHRHTLVLRCDLDATTPEIETVSDIWRTAEFHEREAFDLLGVHFTKHPDLRRLFMPDDYTGFPLRKDFEDPVNMIKL